MGSSALASVDKHAWNHGSVYNRWNFRDHIETSVTFWLDAKSGRLYHVRFFTVSKCSFCWHFATNLLDGVLYRNNKKTVHNYLIKALLANILYVKEVSWNTYVTKWSKLNINRKIIKQELKKLTGIICIIRRNHTG